MSIDRAALARGLGQGLWVDRVSRAQLESGELRRRIVAGAIGGVTSDLSALRRAIESGAGCDAAIAALAAAGADPGSILRRLAVEDARHAADLLRPAWERTQGRDGWVAVGLAAPAGEDEAATVVEGRRRHKECGRPNVMVQVPGTDAGLAAFRRLAEEGVSVAVTRLGSLARCEAAAQAWIAALRARIRRGFAAHTVASVASFSVSRLDAAVDAQLDREAAEASDPAARAGRIALRGRAAIAAARVAYARFRELFGRAFDDCRAKGGRVQRLLWDSSDDADPAAALRRVESLIGADTVHAMAPSTLDRYLEHGNVRTATLLERPDEALETLRSLADRGIDLESIGARLAAGGVAEAARDHGAALAAISARAAAR